MSKYIIKVNVDEDTVKEFAEVDDVIEAITIEAGWMNLSGIYVVDVVEDR